MFKRLLIWLALAAILTLWLVFLMPWHGFPDPDALYHATYSNLMLSNSPLIRGAGGLSNFPWLDLTILGAHFADQHFLFHVLQMPFVNFFGVLQGSRISSIVFALVCLLGLGFIFKKFKISHFWFWILVLAVSQPFCTRILQGKASPLAIVVWFAGVALGLLYLERIKELCHLERSEFDERSRKIWFYLFDRTAQILRLRLTPLRMTKRGFARDDKLKYLLGIFACSFIFTLLHGGWILLPVSLFLIWLGDLIYKKIIPQSVMPNPELSSSGLTRGSRFWIPFFKGMTEWDKGMTPVFFASLLGIALGILIHPGRTQIFQLFWIQVVQIGVFTPVNLNMGNEWSPASWQAAVGLFSIVGILLIIGIIGIFIAPKKQPLDLHTRSVLILSPLVAFLFAISLKSLRYAEYFQPLFTFWVALILQWTQWDEFFSYFSFKIRNSQLATRNPCPSEVTGYKLQVTSWLCWLIVFCITVAAVSNAYGAYTSMHGKLNFTDTTYLVPMLAIGAAANPGDRVFHAQWDEFPALFHLNQNLKYISGLDPTFLYDASTTLALDYSRFSYNAASTTRDFAWNLIHDRTGSKFILVDTNRWPALDTLIASDPRYRKIGDGNGGKAYQLKIQN